MNTKEIINNIKKDKIGKNIFSIIKKYSDVLIVLPIAILLFFNSYWLIRSQDQTAMVLDVGNVSILLFNFLTLMLTFCSASFIYITYFGDAFKKGWEKTINDPLKCSIISGILWISTLIISYLILTRNL